MSGNPHPLFGDCDYREHESMSNHTSLRIGGPADLALFPAASELARIMQILSTAHIPYLVAGKGTNLLVDDEGVEGTVIFMQKMRTFTIEDQEGGIVSVEAGCALPQMVQALALQGLSGMEGLTGIPGSIGGAIAGNAGSYGCEIKDVVESVVLMDQSGAVSTITQKDLRFGYRQAEFPQGTIVLGARLRLKHDSPESIKKRMAGFLEEKKMRQPITLPSAGCVFKNPEGMSAGKLIDDAGCKGMRSGAIEVSTLHANFFINTGRGSARDFLLLMEQVMERVKGRFGIILEPEVKIWKRSERRSKNYFIKE